MGNNTIAIILAAGDKAGMDCSLPKAMHNISYRPIIEYSIKAVQGITSSRPLMVLDGDYKELEKAYSDSVDFIHGETEFTPEAIPEIDWDILDSREEYGLLLAGNIPLITSETLEGLLDFLKEGGYSGVYTPPHPQSGILVFGFKIKSLLASLKQLKDKNYEYTWEVLFNLMENENKGLGVYNVQEPKEVMPINNMADLAKAQREMTLRINSRHLNRGVTIIDPYNTYIGIDVKIEKDAIIYPGNHLEGQVTVGEGTILYPNNRIVDSTLGKGIKVQYSVILESHVGDMTDIGPFAYLRPGSKIGPRVKIGDFVEVKNTEIGEGTKVSHLSYVGDAVIGKDVNVGGGVIFVNYDGQEKHQTHIEDNAFVGCNANLVAPVKVGKEGYIAAGSTITHEVPHGALSIARVRQVNKEGWVEKRKDSKIKRHENETEENR